VGAWGSGSFENDDALDWIADFEDHGVAAIQLALVAVKGSDYIEAPHASAALAAAEAVASVAGRPGARIPDDLRAAIDDHKAAVAAASKLQAEARKVVELVLADSELKELWAEGETPEAQEDFNKWQATVSDLATRLE